MPKSLSQTSLEREALEGDSPVDDKDMVFSKRVGLPELEV